MNVSDVINQSKDGDGSIQEKDTVIDVVFADGIITSTSSSGIQLNSIGELKTKRMRVLKFQVNKVKDSTRTTRNMQESKQNRIMENFNYV